jgi:hypothetical protein
MFCIIFTVFIADEGVVIALCSSFISQLLLLGPAAAIWAPFVALHIPDGLLSLPGTREAAIQRLLQVRRCRRQQICHHHVVGNWLASTAHVLLMC